MKILRLGHAMYVFTSKNGNRYLVDPFFDMNPGCPKEYQTEEFLSTFKGVLLTHGHFDHTSGLDKLQKANPECLIVAQYELALILGNKGLNHVYPLNFGGSFDFEDMKATMVQARHSSSYAELEGMPIYAGESAGYVLEFIGDRTVYHSGDTMIMSDMKLIQDLYQPSIAILSSSGQFTMGPREAAYAVENLLDVEYVIPSHTFPSEQSASSKEVLNGLLQAFPVVGNMIEKDHALKDHLANQSKTKVVVLGYGDEETF